MDCDQQNIYELITGDLSGEEADSLVEHIRRCRRCAERARIMTVLADPEFRSRTRSRFRPGRFLLAAAVLAVAVLIIPPLLLDWDSQNTTTGIRELATKEPYTFFPLEVRSPEDELREQAFTAYRQNRLREADRLFSRIQEEKLNPEVLFFRGVTRYLLGRDEQARSDLENARISEPYRRAATWYLANLFVRRGQVPEALRELHTLQSEEGQFNDEARRLIQTITGRISLP